VAASTLLAVSLASVAFRDSGYTSPGMTGLAITYALQLMGRLQLTVRTSIELENNMTGESMILNADNVLLNIDQISLNLSMFHPPHRI
jgi:hypothetical protein